MVCVWITLTLNHLKVYETLKYSMQWLLNTRSKRILTNIQQMRRFSFQEVTISNFLDVQKVEKDEGLIDIQMHRILLTSSLSSSKFNRLQKSGYWDFRSWAQNYLIHYLRQEKEVGCFLFQQVRTLPKKKTSRWFH